MALVVTSCTPKVGEAPPETPQQKMSGTQCLSDIPPVVEAFIEGEASDAELVAGWDCAATAIAKFKKYVYGRSADRFEASELVEFLKKNFLDPSSADISEELRTEAMRIKQLFLGGSIEYLTRAELDKIINMFEELKGISLRLNPYMKLITQKWSVQDFEGEQQAVRYFEKASDDIQIAARALANVIEENNQTYELDHVTVFLQEFSAFLEQTWEVTGQVEKGMPFFKKVKKAVAGGDPESIGPSEWKSFVLLGARGYLQYLRYHYFIKSAPETGSGIRLGYLARSLEDFLGAFQDLLEQKPADAACGASQVSCISKQEILEIMAALTEVWKDIKSSETLVTEAMKIKKIYFGGSDVTITSRDFERGKNKVAGLKLVVEKFLPYYQLYGLEWDRSNFSDQSAEMFFQEAEARLQESAAELGTLFEDAYSLDSLSALLLELDRLYPNKEEPDKHPALEARKLIPVVKDFKNVIFTENDMYIKKAQWSPFLKFAARIYSSYLYHRYFLKDETYGTDRFLQSLKKLMDRGLDTASEVVLFKKAQKISTGELNLLARGLLDLKLLPVELSPPSLYQVVQVGVNHLLWPTELRLRGAKPDALTPVSIDHLRHEILVWYELERYLYSFGSGPVKAGDLQARIAAKLQDSKTPPALAAGLSELSLMVAGNLVQPVDARGRLVITNLQSLAYDAPSLRRLNQNRTLGRLLIEASVTDMGRLQRYEGVTLAEAKAFYEMVRSAVVDMGLIDKRNVTFVDSRFREANIFTAHSNGDNYVNFAEMADIVGMITSGMTVNKLFRRDIEDDCVSPANQGKKNLVVSERCFRKVYADRTTAYMTSTPEYLKYFNGMSNEALDAFLLNILKSAGHIPNNQNTVSLIDGDLAPHVIQYIEMTVSRYDLDHDGIINLPEAKRAFPSFRGVLLELTKSQSMIKEKDLLALFTYILYYGRAPGGVADFLFKWLPWKSRPEKWTVSADRAHLAGILGYIADEVAKLAPKRALFSAGEEAEIRRRSNVRDLE